MNFSMEIVEVQKEDIGRLLLPQKFILDGLGFYVEWRYTCDSEFQNRPKK